MSANLDLVRSIYADWERGDFSRTDWIDPEIEYVRPDGPAPAIAKGRSALASAMRDFLSVWEHLRIEAEGYRELDTERVLVPNRYVGRGKGSRLEVGQMRSVGAGLFHMCEGKVVKLVYYWDRDRALADLGLEE